MTQWLEQTIGKYPDQWNWMNIRDGTTPPMNPSLPGILYDAHRDKQERGLK